MARRPGKKIKAIDVEEFNAELPKGAKPVKLRPGLGAVPPQPEDKPVPENFGLGLFKALQAADCQQTLGDRLLSQYQNECPDCGKLLMMSVHVLDTTRAIDRYTIVCECGQYVHMPHYVPKPSKT
jgi:hypothetical protein